jgi:thiamine-phosphate pyrophosphorylase
VLDKLPEGILLAARDTLRDVGTGLSTEQEMDRHSLLDVVQAGCKRLQEALRSLEEYGKLYGEEGARKLEAMRYRSYTLERALVLGSAARARLADARLYVLVTGALCARSLEWTVRDAAEGGAQVFQLREKTLNDRDLLERARQMRRWTREAGVLFILNDRPDLARLADADGVHLGQDDLPVKEACRILGPDALVGVSTHNLEQLRQAVLDGASYVGVGPTFPSETKEFGDLAGLDYVRQALAETSLPAFAIGGIRLANVESVVAVGAKRVAVSQAICQAESPQALAAALRRVLG